MKSHMGKKYRIKNIIATIDKDRYNLNSNEFNLSISIRTPNAKRTRNKKNNNDISKPKDNKLILSLILKILDNNFLFIFLNLSV
jgi:hypothetical protein